VSHSLGFFHERINAFRPLEWINKTRGPRYESLSSPSEHILAPETEQDVSLLLPKKMSIFSFQKQLTNVDNLLCHLLIHLSKKLLEISRGTEKKETVNGTRRPREKNEAVGSLQTEELRESSVCQKGIEPKEEESGMQEEETPCHFGVIVAFFCGIAFSIYIFFLLIVFLFKDVE
jgi:hypothetical protein